MQDKSVRCDGCGAEAWVTVTKVFQVKPGSIDTENRYLDFCAHHYSTSSLLLHAQGWSISNDERELINTKPSVSV
jgi:hypothetical protein